MKKLLLLIVASGFFLACNGSVQDTTYAKRIYSTLEVEKPPEIDGWLNDEAWDAVPWEGDFQMFEPYDDRPATQETRFKVVFDGENIYVAIRAFDSAPDSIVHRLTRRDRTDGDIVAVQFDSYHDLQTAFTFFVSAAGSRLDTYETQDGDFTDETWNPIWWVKTQTDDRGWTAEVKIPFSQLRFDTRSDGIWGFQVAREVFRNNETSLWQPMSRESPGWIHLIGELHGLEKIRPHKQAEVVPFAVAGSEWFEKDPEDPYLAEGHDRILNAGLDAKIGITNNMTLDLTVNPDFGQVEADPSEVNLTAFETYFEEQRPFFIEGKNIFDYDLAVHTMDNLFYSRRIGRPPQYDPDLEEGEYAKIPGATRILGAAKITWKTRDGLSVGIMESLTNEEHARISENGMERKETVEPLANYFAGRVSKEFKKGNTILGGMVTSTNRFIDEKQLEILHSSAYSGGIDFQQYFSERNYVFSFKSYMSHVRGSEKALVRTQESSVHYFQRPGAGYIHLDSTRTSLTGYGATTSFGKQYGRLQFQVFLDLFSPGLELNDIGFLNSTDQIMQIAWVGYRFNEPFSIFRSANLNLNQWDAWDFGGNFLFTGFNVNGHAQFKNLWFAGFHVDFESDYRSNIVLRGGPSMLMPGNTSGSLLLETSEQKKFKAELDGSYSFGFNDSYTSYDLEFDLEYKPISNIRISLEPSFSFRNSQLQYVDQFHFDQDDRYIFGSIVQRTVSMSLRLDLVITPELTIQYWGQPFIASGDYSGFKYITDPEAEQYEDRFRLFAEDEIRLDGTEENYLVSEQGGLPAYEFGNPDFNRKEFLSNLVFRWEYRPGSFIYLVWSQGRFGSDLRGNFRPGEDFPDLWDIHPRDVLLLKVSYRLGR